MARKSPIKALNPSAEAVTKQAATDRARKAESKRALRSALKTDADAVMTGKRSSKRAASPAPAAVPALPADPTPVATEPAPRVYPAAVQALRVDYDATHPAATRTDSTPTFEEYCIDQLVDPETGAPIVPSSSRAKYDGPMIALRSARLTYVKAANGILCNGDGLATLLGVLTRAETVALLRSFLIQAEVVTGDLYPDSRFNPGQQSMNWRNKTRHALRTGLVTMAALTECVNRTVAARAPKA